MVTAVIFHGTKGSPAGNWFPWLKTELEQKGYKVFVPELPTPENQNIAAWHDAITHLIPHLDQNSLLIGHSSGATFLLHVLEKLTHSVAHAVFVSPVMDKINIPEYDTLNETFFNHSFNWPIIKQNAAQHTIFHGDDDPYVPINQAQTLAQHLQITPHIIPNGGHLNSESDYTTFPELLTKL